ncbi:uncharacterized protein LOC120143737 [Hibiscus syriacus]|uniref:uncharacterized protein LOC120143737 n=1 Tax=Hibiscus syriacus TaxID=106335 RepID=UPI0019221264|nr:uncharacterized protein LOC120143737 [Hibiscus syriacus]
MNCLFNKLKRLKTLLRGFNKQFFSDISGRVRLKRAELKYIQIFNLAHSSHRRIDDEKMIHAELVNLEVAESDFYRQQAKVSWLREGELNTKFFYQRVQANTKKNTIRVIRCCSVETLRDLLNYTLPDGAISSLTKEVSDKEIKDAFFRQGKDKSPGSDGFTAGFFKAAWDIIGSDFTLAVRYFFHSSCLLLAFNATALVLIPKSLNVCSAKDFRRISCCSVVYKTITRVLVDRLTPYFPDMISHNQYAFVKGRNIVDNTLLAQEIVKCYSRKSLSPRCAVKIDLQKAFDSVNWDFLFFVLGAMGILDIFCNWVKACVTTPMFSVCLNGSLVGHFRGARGIRQGDPFSLYLFVIVMNVLSSLLNVAAMQGIFIYHPKCKRIPLTYLSFADDLLSATGFRLAHLLVRYLGVPLVTRKLTGRDCSALQLILPKGIINDIERLCMRFFWKGCEAPARGARVGWNQVCSLKSEGGLGLRDLALWSKTCCLLLIRNILANEGSIWFAWIQEYCFKTVSFWEFEIRVNFSWILKKLLKLKEVARSMFLPSADLSLVRGKWIWERVRICREKVRWHRIIWFPTHIPKFSLISWMTILDRLPTKDRLVRFGLTLEAGCVVCGIGLESRDHLFPDCSFARDVWNAIFISCGLRSDLFSWDDRLNWLIDNLRGNSLRV